MESWTNGMQTLLSGKDHLPLLLHVCLCVCICVMMDATVTAAKKMVGLCLLWFQSACTRGWLHRELWLLIHV